MYPQADTARVPHEGEARTAPGRAYFTHAEDARIRALLAEGLTYTQVARHFPQRTIASVSARIDKLKNGGGMVDLVSADDPQAYRAFCIEKAARHSGFPTPKVDEADMLALIDAQTKGKGFAVLREVELKTNRYGVLLGDRPVIASGVMLRAA